eukprot:5817589-Pleurochrysis_carterae.AAC.2
MCREQHRTGTMGADDAEGRDANARREGTRGTAAAPAKRAARADGAAPHAGPDRTRARARQACAHLFFEV